MFVLDVRIRYYCRTCFRVRRKNEAAASGVHGRRFWALNIQNAQVSWKCKLRRWFMFFNVNTNYLIIDACTSTC